MSQKYIKSQNKNSHNAKSYGKYYATAVYDNHFIGTEELADFIQQQASVKKSDIKAVLRTGSEGEARRHRHHEGGLLVDRRCQDRGLHLGHDHHTSRAVPA